MRSGTFTLVLAALALGVAGVVSFYASGHPDGLEYVAGSHGFLDTARDSATSDWPLADYAVSGIENVRASGGLAGVIGCALTFAVVASVTRLRGRVIRN